MLYTITIIDKARNKGLDITMRDNKIAHVDYLEPSDWGDYEWEPMD